MGEELEKKPGCDVTEKTGKEFYKCDFPADWKCESPTSMFICKHHLPYALVAGWKMKKIESNKTEENIK